MQDTDAQTDIQERDENCLAEVIQDTFSPLSLKVIVALSLQERGESIERLGLLCSAHGCGKTVDIPFITDQDNCEEIFCDGTFSCVRCQKVYHQNEVFFYVFGQENFCRHCAKEQGYGEGCLDLKRLALGPDEERRIVLYSPTDPWFYGKIDSNTPILVIAKVRKGKSRKGKEAFLIECEVDINPKDCKNYPNVDFYEHYGEEVREKMKRIYRIKAVPSEKYVKVKVKRMSRKVPPVIIQEDIALLFIPHVFSCDRLCEEGCENTFLRYCTEGCAIKSREVYSSVTFGQEKIEDWYYSMRKDVSAGIIEKEAKGEKGKLRYTLLRYPPLFGF